LSRALTPVACGGENILVFGGRSKETRDRFAGTQKKSLVLSHTRLPLIHKVSRQEVTAYCTHDTECRSSVLCCSSRAVRLIKSPGHLPFPCLFAFIFVFLVLLIALIPGFFLGYFIGSVPTAYLLVMWKAQLDIRGKGSGNVGALNAFEVSGSKLVGALVLLLDLGKGALAVWLGSRLFGDDIWVRGLAGIGAVVGHNFSFWLRFRGGRGLATAAGVMLSLNWILVVLWCLLWLASYTYPRNVHVANILASVFSPVLTIPALWLAGPASDGTKGETALFMSVLCLLILVKHLGYVGEFRKVFQKSES
jgi:acyl phosphate:glycerol-3-phosphate acyltransferase